MKKFISYFVMPVMCLLLTSGLNAEQVNDIRSLDANQDGRYDACEVNPNACYQSGPCTCYCPVTRFRPKTYCETKCVQEPYTVSKKCCRMVDVPDCKKCCREVPQYYEKTCCRQVPQYYTKTCCRMVQVPQYYEKTCCRMVPEYYSKKCCRMVKEYYDEPCTKKCPEYYTVCETRYRNKYVKEQKCCYEPYTCMEMRCVNAPLEAVCNANQQQQNMNNQAPYYNPQQAAQPVDQVSMNSGSFAANDSALAQALESKIQQQNILTGKEYVDITVENGLVHISGLVYTPVTKKKIETFVSGQNGVGQVVNEIRIDSSTRN